MSFLVIASELPCLTQSGDLFRILAASIVKVDSAIFVLVRSLNVIMLEDLIGIKRGTKETIIPD